MNIEYVYWNTMNFVFLWEIEFVEVALLFAKRNPECPSCCEENPTPAAK